MESKFFLVCFEMQRKQSGGIWKDWTNEFKLGKNKYFKFEGFYSYKSKEIMKVGNTTQSQIFPCGVFTLIDETKEIKEQYSNLLEPLFPLNIWGIKEIKPINSIPDNLFYEFTTYDLYH